MSRPARHCYSTGDLVRFARMKWLGRREFGRGKVGGIDSYHEPMQGELGIVLGRRTFAVMHPAHQSLDLVVAFGGNVSVVDAIELEPIGRQASDDASHGSDRNQ